MKRFVAAIALLASACTTLEPRYERPAPPIPASWPAGDPYLLSSEAGLPILSYQQIFQDARLQTLVAQALVNNRDLSLAAANIAAARAQYQVQRANQLPQLNAQAGASVSGDKSGDVSGQFDAGLAVPSYELDLFGRLRSLTNVQRQRYFATEAAARATRLTLVADIADAWLTHAADQSLLAIAEETATSAGKSVELTRIRLEGGIAPRTDLRQAEEIQAQAQADLARQRTAVAQDKNLLELLVGAPVDPNLLARSIDEAFASVVPPPTGLDSYVLLRRPDVVEAEYQLKAANAQIGAARAALFPKISLTGLAGLASSALTSLFTGGAFAFSAGADATYSIFNGGAARANIRLSEAQRQAALATYEKAIQAAFREVADALARRGTINDEIAARQRQKAAAADLYLLTEARYKAGIDNFLASLDAQRSYYATQQSLVSTKLTAAENLVELYRAIGGDMLIPPNQP
jgi:multidrug efflux system outer membrane protein